MQSITLRLCAIDCFGWSRAADIHFPRLMHVLTYVARCLFSLHVMKAAPSSLPPHVFAVADKAYSTLLRTHKSQVSLTVPRGCFCKLLFDGLLLCGHTHTLFPTSVVLRLASLLDVAGVCCVRGEWSGQN